MSKLKLSESLASVGAGQRKILKASASPRSQISKGAERKKGKDNGKRSIGRKSAER